MSHEHSLEVGSRMQFGMQTSVDVSQRCCLLYNFVSVSASDVIDLSTLSIIEKIFSARCAQFLVKVAARLPAVGDLLGVVTLKVVPEH